MGVCEAGSVAATAARSEDGSLASRIEDDPGVVSRLIVVRRWPTEPYQARR